jgi:hypothetical protein
LARAMAAILSAAIALPVEASACHHYSRWYYPWPQRCGVGHAALHNEIISFGREIITPKRNDFEIALPGLAQADLDGGGADEPTRARLLLRAALEAANGH